MSSSDDWATPDEEDGDTAGTADASETAPVNAGFDPDWDLRETAEQIDESSDDAER